MHVIFNIVFVYDRKKVLKGYQDLNLGGGA